MVLTIEARFSSSMVDKLTINWKTRNKGGTINITSVAVILRRRNFTLILNKTRGVYIYTVHLSIWFWKWKASYASVINIGCSHLNLPSNITYDGLPESSSPNFWSQEKMIELLKTVKRQLLGSFFSDNGLGNCYCTLKHNFWAWNL